MQARMQSPAGIYPGAYKGLLAMAKATEDSGVPQKTLHLVHLRASQINGCGFCVHLHSSRARKDGETEERLSMVVAWRESPFFSDAERAALALTEAATRLSDRPNPVPDDVWDEAAHHYNEKGLAALVIHIAQINAWNRIQVSTQQIAGPVDGVKIKKS